MSTIFSVSDRIADRRWATESAAASLAIESYKGKDADGVGVNWEIVSDTNVWALADENYNTILPATPAQIEESTNASEEGWIVLPNGARVFAA